MGGALSLHMRRDLEDLGSEGQAWWGWNMSHVHLLFCPLLNATLCGLSRQWHKEFTQKRHMYMFGFPAPLRPFTRKLPEFKFWWSGTRAAAVAFASALDFEIEPWISFQVSSVENRRIPLVSYLKSFTSARHVFQTTVVDGLVSGSKWGHMLHGD